jgi:hypothetical protein
MITVYGVAAGAEAGAWFSTATFCRVLLFRMPARGAQLGSPRRICRHLADDIRKLRETFHADVPGLLTYGLHELIALEPGILSRPGVRCGE